MPKLTLTHPLPGGAAGGTIDSLTFSNMRGGDYTYQDVYGENHQMLALIASLTGMDAGIIRRLHGPDFIAARKKARAILNAAAEAAKNITTPEGLEFPLVEPIEIGDKGHTVKQIRFRDYTTTEDYLALDIIADGARTLTMIASLTGTDIALINKMSGPDYLVAIRKVEEILDKDDSFDKPAKVDPEGETDPKKPE